MTLRDHKTKIVATIGPASASPETLRAMIRAGMDVARLNFSHGDFEGHHRAIALLREAARAESRRLAILADLPGPKIRLGRLATEPITLQAGGEFTLTTEDITGDDRRASVSFTELPKAARPGDVLFLNDGLIELEVLTVAGHDVACRVRVGGELRSRKGLNLPGIDLGICAFTERDRECLAFALAEGVDVISQSFVESPEDVAAVREAAAAMGHHPFVVAKIERARALDRIDEILDAADAVMIARGDLGVEVPIERIAVVQKDIARKANLAGKPVITATQMLESMTRSRRPTRAEATDVANAILDGTDAVMLSEESATGAFPVDAVSMLARIAAAIEPHRPAGRVREALGRAGQEGSMSLRDVIASSVDSTLERASPAAVIVPTDSGATARSVARFRPPVWIAAISTREETCRRLQLSWGVHALHVAGYPDDWKNFARAWLRENGIEGNRVVLMEGPSPKHPEANHRMEIIDLDGDN